MTANSASSDFAPLQLGQRKQTPEFHHSDSGFRGASSQSTSLGREVFRSIPPWLISTTIHTLLIVALGFLSFQKSGKDETSVSLNGQLLESPPTVTFNSPETNIEKLDVDSVDSSKSVKLDDVPTSNLDDSEKELQGGPIGDLIPKIHFADSLSRLATKTGGGGDGGVGSGDSANKKSGGKNGNEGTGEASFYGIKAEGNTFVYVLDNSGSMAGNRWLEARNEVIRSIQALGENQKFLVVLYNTHTKVMLHMRGPKIRCLKADEKTKTRVVEWLQKQYPQMDTLPLNAIKIGIRMKADHIFLLSDGEFDSETLNFLRKKNLDRNKSKSTGSRVNRVTVHTIAFKSNAGATMLQQIARENAGTFKYVQ